VNRINLTLIYKSWTKIYPIIKTKDDLYLVVLSQEIDDVFSFKYNHIRDEMGF